jgi:hypothetical protein
MRIYIDFNGTISGNPAGTLQECLQAAHDLADAGHDVTLVSGDPESAAAHLGGCIVADKLEVLGRGLLGAMVIDDDPLILAAVARQGAVAVPAAMLIEVSRAMRRVMPFPFSAYPPREIADEVAARIVLELGLVD